MRPPPRSWRSDPKRAASSTSSRSRGRPLAVEAGAAAARAAREHVRVMEQAIEEGGDGGGVGEQLAPVLERTVRGGERRRPLVATADRLERVPRGGRRALAPAGVI